MFTRKAEPPLVVQVPTASQDRPSWTKVGVITAIGFIVGVAWPRLAGVRMGPSVPETASTASAAASSPAPVEPAPSVTSSAALPAVVSSPAVVAAPPPPSAPAPAATPAAAPSVAVTVGHGAVFACSTSAGDALKGGACGALPGLDGIVMPRLRKLAECTDATAATGKLHLVVRVDFGRPGVRVELGHNRGFSATEPALACAKAALAGANVSSLAHDNPRYSVAYSVTFGTEAAETVRSGDEPAAPDGPAQIVWDVALVRDAPKTGKVVAKLQRGTAVHLGAVKDGWYPVKYGDGFASDGWIYRGALGK